MRFEDGFWLTMDWGGPRSEITRSRRQREGRLMGAHVGIGRTKLVAGRPSNQAHTILPYVGERGRMFSEEAMVFSSINNLPHQ